MFFTKFVLLGSVAFNVSAAQCTGAIGAVASLVSTLPAAQSFCTSRFSRPPVTVTTTATTNTITVTAATSTATVTSYLLTTSTLTSVHVFTITIVDAKKRAVQAITLTTKASTQDARALALSSLTVAASTVASSLCACITTRPTATSTIVVTPTAIAAGTVGIAATALQSAKILLASLQEIQDAPQTVQTLKNDLIAFNLALAAFQAIGDDKWNSVPTAVVEQTNNMLETCESACQTFITDLKRWTKHSKSGELSKRDRLNVGVFRTQQIQFISLHLQACKLNILSIATSSVLRITDRSAHDTAQIMSEVSKIRANLSEEDKQINDVEITLDQLQIAEPGQDSGESVEDKRRAVEQVEERRTALLTSQKLCQEMLAIADEIVKRETGQTIMNLGANNSGAQLGHNYGPMNLSFGKKD